MSLREYSTVQYPKCPTRRGCEREVKSLPIGMRNSVSCAAPARPATSFRRLSLCRQMPLAYAVSSCYSFL